MMRAEVSSPRDVLALLHSSASSARQWDVLGKSLAGIFDVHAIDFHGHGTRAPWAGPGALTLAHEATPIDGLIERHGAIHVVGHSYGGAVALDIARRHPGAVRSVAVYEPVVFGLLAADPRCHAEAAIAFDLAAGLHAHLDQGNAQAAGERFVNFWSGPGAWMHLGSRRQAGVAARMASVVQHFDAAFAAPDARPSLARIPLLCLTGAATVPVTRRIGELLETSLPHAEHECLASLGHLGPITAADVVNARLTDFLLRQVHQPIARRGAAASHASGVPQTSDGPALV